MVNLSVEFVANNDSCSQRELRRRQKVESRASRETSNRQQDSASTHTARPCCSQGYAHCPRALHRPLPPSRRPSRLCAFRHQPSTPTASLCAMPRIRPREPPTLQRMAQERDWVLRRVEVCHGLTTSFQSSYTHLHHLFSRSSTISIRKPRHTHIRRRRNKIETNTEKQNNT